MGHAMAVTELDGVTADPWIGGHKPDDVSYGRAWVRQWQDRATAD